LTERPIHPGETPADISDVERAVGDPEAELPTAVGRAGHLTDDVTGLRLRESFDEILKDEAGRAARADRALGLLVIGMDALPALRADHGEPAAEAILRQAARRLSAATRDSDIIARYGQEEFAVLLLGAGPDVLLDVADRCRRSVAGRYFELPDGERIPVTVSVGGAGRPIHAHAAGELVAVAKRAFDRAREGGRNCLHIGLLSRLPVAELTDVTG
jgi:diguanylate cyclase (GGDEF)-like protein